MIEKNKIFFTAREVFEASIDLENSIKQLYINLSHVLKSTKERIIFAKLAADEEKHEVFLRQNLSRINNVVAAQRLENHIHELSHYFFEKYMPHDTLSERLKHINTIEGIFELAIEIELDHILYYQEIRTMVIDEEQDFIEDILRDARSHFVKLMQHLKAADFSESL